MRYEGRLEAGVVGLHVAEDRTSEILGSGFMVRENLLLTCAHVVGDRKEVYAVFLPGLSQAPRKAKRLWIGNPDGYTDDIAVLEILEPAPKMTPLPLEDHQQLDRFATTGFPVTSEEGAAVQGTVVALTHSGWVQIDVEGVSRVEEGFSGTAAWSPRCSGALGMIVARGLDEQAFMIPSARLREALRLADLAKFSPWLSRKLPKLLDQCEDISFTGNEVSELYRQCAPPDWRFMPEGKGIEYDLRDVLLRLAEAPRQSTSGAYPLLQFVHLLHSHGKVRTETQSEIRLWLANAENHFGRGSAVVLPEKINKVNKYYVLIKTQVPSWVDSDLRQDVPCEISAYLVGGSRPAHLFDKSSTLTAEKAGKSLYEIMGLAVESALDDGIDPHAIQFEFLLPKNLMSLDVDRWMLKLSFETMPIGVSNPVVVRSLERDADRVLRRILSRRWDKYLPKKHIQISPMQLNELNKFGEMSLVAFSEQRCGPSLAIQLKDSELLCATLLWAPGEKDRMLLNLIQAGIPMILWLRKPKGSAEETLAFFQELLAGGTFGSLPDAIHKARIEAAKIAEDHAGHHLTLVWDDPKRPFPGHAVGSQFIEPPIQEEGEG